MLVSLLSLHLDTHAQSLDPAWIAQTEAQIEEHRKGELCFIVLDAEGRPAEGIDLRVQQVRHAFELGFTWHDTTSAMPRWSAGDPVWRVFNALSLAGITSWRQRRSDDAEAVRHLHQTIGDKLTMEQGRAVMAWGPVLSADPADMPDAFVPMRGNELRQAASREVQEVVQGYPALDRLVLCNQTLRHDRISLSLLRLLRMEIEALRPDMRVDLSYEGVFDKTLTRDILQAADAAEKAFVGHDGITLAGEIDGKLLHQDLTRTLGRIAVLNKPITLVDLEIGGANVIDQMVNAEVLLRWCFAEPMIRGMYFQAVTAEHLKQPEAALIDEQGQPTGIGRTLDRLFREQWWTQEKTTTDDLGNARVRAFYGILSATAYMPDGSAVSTLIRFDPPRHTDASPRLVVLQPLEPMQ